MYSGTVTDSVLGTGTAVANLSQTFGPVGDPIGGWLSFTFGSVTYNNPTVGGHPTGEGEGGGLRRLDEGGGGGNAVHGNFIMIIASTACSFHYRGSFNPSSFQLNGDYRALNGCSGEKGTFSLQQQCYYQIRGYLRRTSGSGPGICS